jgi:4-azaleucine resistance transporter AzlC
VPVLRDALARTLPLAPGIVPLGLLFGATAVSAGFTLPQATLLSAVVFAGTAQFASVALASAGASLAAILATVAMINSRYLLMTIAALEPARRAGAARATRVALALGVVDETYAVQSAWKGAPVGGLLLVSLLFWAMWVGGTILGALVGARLPDLRPFGLDYALPGLFVGLFGIFADSRAKLVAGLAALAAAAALTLAGAGTAAILLVPPVVTLAAGRIAR